MCYSYPRRISTEFVLAKSRGFSNGGTPLLRDSLLSGGSEAFHGPASRPRVFSAFCCTNSSTDHLTLRLNFLFRRGCFLHQLQDNDSGITSCYIQYVVLLLLVSGVYLSIIISIFPSTVRPSYLALFIFLPPTMYSMMSFSTDRSSWLRKKKSAETKTALSEHKV